MKRILNDVHPGQIWRDRDPRSWSGNRRVIVRRVVRESDGKCLVYYAQIIGTENTEYDEYKEHKSRYERFQRAFELLALAEPQK